VALEDRETGKIAFAPLQLELGKLTSGTHTLDITAFGNRFNALGYLHNADEKTVWLNTRAWRTAGDACAYENQWQGLHIKRVAPGSVAVTPNGRLA
jgi:hypothetical protein